jgi:hypothetical protein
MRFSFFIFIFLYIDKGAERLALYIAVQVSLNSFFGRIRKDDLFYAVFFFFLYIDKGAERLALYIAVQGNRKYFFL